MRQMKKNDITITAHVRRNSFSFVIVYQTETEREIASCKRLAFLVENRPRMFSGGLSYFICG